MARQNSLEVAAHTILTKGGYGRTGNATHFNCPAGSDCFSGNCDWVELINGSCAPLDPGGGFTAADDSGSLTRTYTWRDSNIDEYEPGTTVWGGKNSNSGEAYVTVRDDWVSTVDDENNLVVTTKTYIIEHGRRDIRTNKATPLRDDRIYGFNQKTKNWDLYLEFLGEPVNQQKVYFSGEKYVGTNTFTLPPQTTSAGINYTVMVWNKTSGSQFPYEEPYLDELMMGLQFKNGLPNELDPPRLQGVTQLPDICEYTVTANFTFSAPNMNAVLVFDWKYNDQSDYPSNNRITIEASKSIPTTFSLYDLYPTGYQQSSINWRAQYQPRPGSKLQPSDWTYGSENVVFILPPDATVPDVTTPECSEIGRGGLLPEYDYITYYDERNKI